MNKEKYIYEDGRAREQDEFDLNTGAEKYFDQGTFIPMRLAKEIQKDYIFKNTEDNETLYFYTNGIYKPLGEVLVKGLSQKILDKKSTAHRIKETINFVKNDNFIDRGVFDTDPKLINLLNGVYDIEKGKLLPHDPEVFSVVQLPINYDAEAVCPTFINWVNEITDGRADTVQEMFGYCLFKDHEIHKAFLFQGSGRNGKSTLLKILTKLLGQENVSDRGLQDLEHNRFAMADLFGKLANIHADISDLEMKSTSALKMLTGGDQLTGEFKHKDSFTFTNYAKQLYSCNTIPKVYDKSDAFFARWIILCFPNQYIGKKADREIFKKFTAEYTMSGIFNWGIEGLNRLLKNGTFTGEKSIDEVREEYILLSDPFACFVKDKMEKKAEGFLFVSDLYEAYKEYMHEHRQNINTQAKVTQEFKQKVDGMEYTQRRKNGQRERGFLGIRLKGEIEPKKENNEQQKIGGFEDEKI